MTVSSIYHGSTTTPLAHVRTVQVKSKPVGWLECTANEFLRLLAEHEAGKINLLEMPECANDTDDDDADDTDDKPAAQPAASREADPLIFNRGGTAVMIHQCLTVAGCPLTPEAIARHCGRSLNAVRSALRRNPTMFVIAGDAREDGRKKTWAKADR